MATDPGGGFRKVRSAIQSKGKSGGAGEITLDLLERNGVLYLIFAYDKSDSSSVEMAVIRELTRQMGL